MEISAEKTKLMTNNTSGINTEIKMNGQKLEIVTSFKYLGSVIADEGSKPEILSIIAQTTAALTRLKPVWIDKSVSVGSKILLLSLIHISEPTRHQFISYAVFFNGSIGDWFRTTIGVRQGCLLSPTLFNIFLERTMTYA